MRTLLAPLALFLALSAGGCTAIDNLSDDDLAKDILIGSSKVIEAGVKLAIEKYPEKAAAIKKELSAASLVIKTNILPSFMSPTGDVVVSAVKTAMTLLDSKITNEQLKKNIIVAIDLLNANVTMPSNPLEKLDARTTKALIGLFSGILMGLDSALAQ